MSTENPTTTPSVTLKDAVAYVYTSGTTGGLPKAAVIINKRAVSAMFWFGRVVMRVRPSDTIYIPLPFFHTKRHKLWLASCAIQRRGGGSSQENSAPANFLTTSEPFRVTHFVYVERCAAI